MKMLDVNLLQDGLQRNMAMLERLETEVSNINDSIKGLVAMEEVLKGAGGSAIRNFYSEVHLPFLHFFLLFTERFKQQLQHIETALTSLEPDTAGHILEQFLEGELEQGLTQIGTLTERFTNDANSIMETISDIVALPPLDDSEVQEGVRNSKQKRDNTITDLHQFDTSQTTSLSTVEQNLQELGLWIVLMEGMFGAGVKVTSFQSSQWKAITFGSGIRTELFPKVYLDPNNLWVEEYEELIGTTINSDTFETLEGMKVSLIEENVGENIKYHAYANGLIIKETMDGGKSSYEVVSEVIYKENDQADEPQENKVLDGIQLGLDILGLIPVVGEVADGVNGIIYTARGDMLNAGLSFGSMIPFVGWGTTGARFAIKGGRAIEDARDVNRVTENVKPGSQGMDDTTSYFRVQGGEMPNASQVRIQVDNNGRMIIPNKDANLNVSAGTREHAEYFLEKRGAGAEIVEIEVPRWFDDFVQESAIPQFRYKNNPLNQGGTAPKVVDPSTPGTSFEFPSPWIEWLEEYGKIKK
ncbi:T7SS effector LXG polymorphic toxin [uncultured Psychrobacillus sp.]|uniref:T7SS effector LXG polymorphic toxin n=1 Tax=uncultured Psychrobacillus sp. TaxID=1551585 RepID=UPI00261D14DB|nr:T7SS effector LXG polymorphic toxin [uncultured Psychrobacillus sp.]